MLQHMLSDAAVALRLKRESFVTAFIIYNTNGNGLMVNYEVIIGFLRQVVKAFKWRRLPTSVAWGPLFHLTFNKAMPYGIGL